MKCKVFKDLPPIIILEVWKVVGGCGKGGKSIVGDDMKLWSDDVLVSLWARKEGNRAGVFVGESEIDSAS